VAETKCPDCDGPRIGSVPPTGNGKCSQCHGTGSAGVMESLGSTLFGQRAKCPRCHGTKKCQTCDGKGSLKT